MQPSRLIIPTPDRRRRRGSPFARALAAAAPIALLVATTALAAETHPLTVTDSEGTDVAIEARPERIVSFSPAITEIIFALGAGDRLVGGTDFDDFPPAAAELEDVATFTGVIIERVVHLEPDLVIAAGNAFTPADDIARLRELGYPVVVVYAPDVESVLTDIELIGAAVGEADEAERLTGAMRARIAAISEAVDAVGERPRTFYQIGSEPEIYGPAPESFVADMIELAGGDPITTGDPAVFSIPVEQLVVADPEVIVVGDANYGVCPADVAARPGWGGMSAVVDGAVRPVDDVPVTRPGPRLADGLAALALAIHPALELADAPAPPALCAA